MKAGLLTLFVAVFCVVAFAEEQNASDLVEERGVSTLRQNILEELRGAQSSAICDAARNARNARDSDQSVLQRKIRQCVLEKTPKFGGGCEGKSRDDCTQLEDNTCQWIAALGECQYNPCRFLNNGLCNSLVAPLCVWYKKGDSIGIAPDGSEVTAKVNGCFQNPCSNPTPNTQAGCLNGQRRSNTRTLKYTCEWCKGGFGCRGPAPGEESCGKDVCPNGKCNKFPCQFKGNKANPYCQCWKEFNAVPDTARECANKGANLKGLGVGRG